MRVFRFIFTTYFLLVFLSSTCAKNRARFKSKKNTWRLRLLRKLSKLYPEVELLSLKNKHNTYLPNNYNGSINGRASSGKHVPVIRKLFSKSFILSFWCNVSLFIVISKYFFLHLQGIVLLQPKLIDIFLIMFGKIRSGSWKLGSISNSTHSSIMK